MPHSIHNVDAQVVAEHNTHARPDGPLAHIEVVAVHDTSPDVRTGPTRSARDGTDNVSRRRRALVHVASVGCVTCHMRTPWPSGIALQGGYRRSRDRDRGSGLGSIVEVENVEKLDGVSERRMGGGDEVRQLATWCTVVFPSVEPLVSARPLASRRHCRKESVTDMHTKHQQRCIIGSKVDHERDQEWAVGG